MWNFTCGVREFFSTLFGKPKPKYIGFLRKPSIEDGKPSKQKKNPIGFLK